MPASALDDAARRGRLEARRRVGWRRARRDDDDDDDAGARARVMDGDAHGMVCLVASCARGDDGVEV